MTIKNRTVGLELSTSNQDIYTVPANFKGTVDSIIITNKTASYVDVSLDWYSSLSTTYYSIFGSTAMEPNSTLQITHPLYLEAGDKIRGLATLNNTVVVSVRTSEEYSVSTR